MPLDHTEIVHLVPADGEHEPLARAWQILRAQRVYWAATKRGAALWAAYSRRHDFGELQDILTELIVDFTQAVLVQSGDVEIHRQRPVPAHLLKRDVMIFGTPGHFHAQASPQRTSKMVFFESKSVMTNERNSMP